MQLLRSLLNHTSLRTRDAPNGGASSQQARQRAWRRWSQSQQHLTLTLDRIASFRYEVRDRRVPAHRRMRASLSVADTISPASRRAR